MNNPVAILTTNTDGQPVLHWAKGLDHSDLPYGPLYAIPEGYHIVAIDSEQKLRDNLERHNEKVKSKIDDGDKIDRYWLCCGDTNPEHGKEKSGKCQEARAGYQHRCNYGTREEQKKYMDCMKSLHGQTM